MIKTTFILLSVLLFVLICIYSWQNRDSDRVALAFIAAIMIGPLGFIANEFISNKHEGFSYEYPVAVFYGLPDYRPLRITLPYQHKLMMLIQNIDTNDIPDNGNAMVDIGFAGDKYFDAIQLLIISRIFETHRQSWNVKTKRTTTPTGKSLSWQSIPEKGKEISFKDILGEMPKNYFIKMGLDMQFLVPFGGKAMFPPDTEIGVKHEDDGRKLTVSFITKYTTLKIDILQSESTVGVGREYSRILEISPIINVGEHSESTAIGNSVYLVQISATQNYLLNGHPEMKKHRNWADSIAQMIDTEFNFGPIREDHMRQFQLHGRDAVLGH